MTGESNGVSWELRQGVAGIALAIALKGIAVADDSLSTGVDAYQRGEYAVARDVFGAAAAAGDARAQYLLGTMYQNGLGVEPDEYEAFSWFHKAAESEYLAAQFQLGIMYLDGVGVTESEPRAMEWIWKAADRGYPQAKDVLQFLLFKDFTIGC